MTVRLTGIIAAFDMKSKRGHVQADDGHRLIPFTHSETDFEPVKPNLRVSFEIDHGHAVDLQVERRPLPV